MIFIDRGSWLVGVFFGIFWIYMCWWLMYNDLLYLMFKEFLFWFCIGKVVLVFILVSVVISR